MKLKYFAPLVLLVCSIAFGQTEAPFPVTPEAKTEIMLAQALMENAQLKATLAKAQLDILVSQMEGSYNLQANSLQAKILAQRTLLKVPEDYTFDGTTYQFNAPPPPAIPPQNPPNTPAAAVKK